MNCLCRFCQKTLSQTLVDLGETPLANSYVSADDVKSMVLEKRFPLRVMVCNYCWLAQTTETISADGIFKQDYAYLSSYSSGWVAHAHRYADEMSKRFDLGPNSKVVEIASNDGYLLQHFVALNIPVLGVEPAGDAAALAEGIGVPTRVMFFDETSAITLSEEGIAADLMVANNVLAHVPNIRSFVAGFKTLMNPNGVATFEFPHIASLLGSIQFDTIYHEHYSYLSLTFLEKLVSEIGMSIFDVEKLPTHGGSLRVFICHPDAHVKSFVVDHILAQEVAMELDKPSGYEGFTTKVNKVTSDFLTFLAEAKLQGKTIAGYGAAAKGNTFLNVAKVGASDLDFVVDLNTQKQGKLLPGSHIPIMSPEKIKELKPDYLVILPWNLADEIIEQQQGIREWGGQFVTAVPELRIR